jgi:hypothetical protein
MSVESTLLSLKLQCDEILFASFSKSWFSRLGSLSWTLDDSGSLSSQHKRKLTPGNKEPPRVRTWKSEVLHQVMGPLRVNGGTHSWHGGRSGSSECHQRGRHCESWVRFSSSHTETWHGPSPYPSLAKLSPGGQEATVHVCEQWALWNDATCCVVTQESLKTQLEKNKVPSFGSQLPVIQTVCWNLGSEFPWCVSCLEFI